MTAHQPSPEWRIIGETVPGASHVRAGIPNQDAILQLRASSRSLPLILSVSDGHGSYKCFRSDRGARFAVKVGGYLASDFLDTHDGELELAALESSSQERLAQQFVKRWRRMVEADLKRHPFTEEELVTLEQKSGAGARELIAANPSLAYGATSLTVAVAESFILYLQLGDGEILTVSAKGEVSKPLPEDERLFANETTSLCAPDAEQNFRFHLQPLSAEPPALILVTTDGYANSFSSAAGFLQVGSDLLEMLRLDGFDSVNENVRGWLEEATRVGSGDDSTLGIICRMDALSEGAAATQANAPAQQEEAENIADGAGVEQPTLSDKQGAALSPAAAAPVAPDADSALAEKRAN